MSDTFADGITSLISLPVPRGPGWIEVANARALMRVAHPLRAWNYSAENIFAIIAVEFIDDGKVDGPEFHLSISHPISPGVVGRVNRNDSRWVLRQFGMEGSKEDNHVPDGKARNFWLPVAKSMIGRECPCVETENAIVEDRGDYVWRA